MSRDLRNNISVQPCLYPAARTAAGTGATVDRQGYESAAMVVEFGAWTDGTHTPRLEESTDLGTTFTTVAAADLEGTFTTVSAGAGSNSVQRVGYKGSARHIRPMLAVGTGTTGALSSMHVVLGHPALAPVT